MQLSLEIPVAYLKQWGPLTDFDFALAHRVLSDPVYRKHYATREAGRELLLDNSMHELGTPLPIASLADAAFAVGADYVIAPDQLGMPDWNLEQYRLTLAGLKGRFKIAVVMAGATPTARAEYLDAVAGADMICLPFREPRLRWFQEQRERILDWTRIHLLGVNEISELKGFVRYARGASLHEHRTWSVDTAKPIKWGWQLKSLNHGETLRSSGISSLDLLDLRDATPEQRSRIVQNIHYLKGVLEE
jgi:hypothetical protein